MRFPRDRTQIATLGGTLLAVAGLVLTLAGARTPGPDDITGEVFAWVNERPVTGAQVEQAQQRLTAAGGVGATDAERRSLVQLLVDEELLLQRAESLGVLQADPGVRKAIVRATTHWQDPKVVAEVSRGIGDAMPGLDMAQVPEEEKLQTRGW